MEGEGFGGGGVWRMTDLLASALRDLSRGMLAVYPLAETRSDGRCTVRGIGGR